MGSGIAGIDCGAKVTKAAILAGGRVVGVECRAQWTGCRRCRAGGADRGRCCNRVCHGTSSPASWPPARDAPRSPSRIARCPK